MQASESATLCPARVGKTEVIAKMPAATDTATVKT